MCCSFGGCCRRGTNSFPSHGEEARTAAGRWPWGIRPGVRRRAPAGWSRACGLKAGKCCLAWRPQVLGRPCARTSWPSATDAPVRPSASAWVSLFEGVRDRVVLRTFSGGGGGGGGGGGACLGGGCLRGAVAPWRGVGGVVFSGRGDQRLLGWRQLEEVARPKVPDVLVCVHVCSELLLRSR